MSKYALYLKSDNERLTVVELNNSGVRYKIDEYILAHDYFCKLKNMDKKSFDLIFFIDKV